MTPRSEEVAGLSFFPPPHAATRLSLLLFTLLLFALSYTMAPSPTEQAPTSMEELKELLKDDIMVKVAGELTVTSATDSRY